MRRNNVLLVLIFSLTLTIEADVHHEPLNNRQIHQHV